MRAVGEVAPDGQVFEEGLNRQAVAPTEQRLLPARVDDVTRLTMIPLRGARFNAEGPRPARISSTEFSDTSAPCRDVAEQDLVELRP